VQTKLQLLPCNPGR